MGTRLFTPNDTVNLWELLNEVKGWVDDLGDQGVSARFWTGSPGSKSPGNGTNTSVKFSTAQLQAGLDLTWDGDTFSLPPGKYRIDAQLTFDADADGYRVLSLIRNPGWTTYSGSSTPAGTFLRAVQVAASSNNTSVQLTKVVAMSSTDKLALVCRQNSGGSLAILTAPQDSELMIQRIGD